MIIGDITLLWMWDIWNRVYLMETVVSCKQLSWHVPNLMLSQDCHGTFAVETEWSPIYRRHSQMTFIEWKSSYFASIIIESRYCVVNVPKVTKLNCLLVNMRWGSHLLKGNFMNQVLLKPCLTYWHITTPAIAHNLPVFNYDICLINREQ